MSPQFFCPADLSKCLDLAFKNFTDIHSSTKIICTKLRILLINIKKNPNPREIMCVWLATDFNSIGWLGFVYLPYFPHASFPLASFRSMQKVRICCHRNGSYMLFWKIWKYNALYTQENNNVLSINRLICSYYICCLRDLFKKKQKNPKAKQNKKTLTVH